MKKLAEFPHLRWLSAETTKLYAAISIAVGLVFIAGLCTYVFVAVIIG